MSTADEKMLGATLLGALGVQTVGAVDADHKLPSPRYYATVLLLWWLLGVVAAMGERLARLAATFSMLVLLALAMGKAGLKALEWLGGIGGRLAGEPAPTNWGGLGTIAALVQGLASKAVAGAGGSISVPTSAVASHCTSGLAGFPAIDISGSAGAAVLAPEDGRIDNPHAIGWRDGFGGQTFYFRGDSGTVYWLTHMDETRPAPAGDYSRGDVIGYLTSDPDKAELINGNHVHVGSPSYTGLQC